MSDALFKEYYWKRLKELESQLDTALVLHDYVREEQLRREIDNYKKVLGIN